MCSLVLLTGWAGQISLGQLADHGVWRRRWRGRLTLQGKDFFLCLGLAGVPGAVVALALGIPALRIKGPFLAVTSLAFALTTTYFLNHQYFPWLMPAVSDRLRTRPVIFDKFDLESDYAYYYVILFALALDDRVGVAAAAVTNRDASSSRTATTRGPRSRYGINPARAQLAAFALVRLPRRPGRRAVCVPPAPAVQHGARPGAGHPRVLDRRARRARLRRRRAARRRLPLLRQLLARSRASSTPACSPAASA